MSIHPRTLADLGEHALIERLRAALPSGRGVVIGPGDDAAAVRTEELTLASADLLIEGVHFDFAFATPRDVGFKAMVVNVSDIGAMGGIARHALVSVGAPGDTSLAVWDGVVEGMIEAASDADVGIVGGDCSVAPVFVINVAIMGTPGPGAVMTRDGARDGDVLCVTGSLGAAATGLELLRAASSDPRAAALLDRFPGLAAAHRRPPKRWAAGAAAASAGATAMIDISDGLARDARHIAQESKTGVVIDATAIPIGDGVREVAGELGLDAIALAAGGGEDYELAIAVVADRVDALREALAPVPVTAVGRFGGDDRVLERDGERIPLEKLGWEHFA